MDCIAVGAYTHTASAPSLSCTIPSSAIPSFFSSRIDAAFSGDTMATMRDRSRASRA